MFQNPVLAAFLQKADIKSDSKIPGVNADDEMNSSEFNYIVQKRDPAHICFLSGQQRYPKKIKKSITATATIISPEKCSAINALLAKVRSKRGVGGLADLSDRFQKIRLDDIPGPTKYDPEHKKKIEQSKYPFGIGKSTNKVILNKNPGPGSYDEPLQCRRQLKKHKFGNKTQLIPCVETICLTHAIDKCALCQNICEGDYWHVEYLIFLCLKCMRLERRALTKFSKQDLKKFKKIRNCSFMHRHEGTTAAIRLLQKPELCTKFRKENYLENYFNKYY